MSELKHYGTPHAGNIPHSGRYEYGSGKKYKSGSYLAKMDFLAQYDKLKAEGMSEREIVSAMGFESVNEFRKQRSSARAEALAANISRAQRLKAHGYGATEIGRKMGVRESTVRGWLQKTEETRKTKIDNVADAIEERLKRGEIIDVGSGTEIAMGVTSTTLGVALKQLSDKGYVVDNIQLQQPLDPNKATTIKYIAPEGTTKKDVWDSRSEITTMTEYSPNQGIEFNKVANPSSISMDRVAVVFKEDGGEDRDGMVGIRRNVEDLTLGNSSYAQVRIAVDGKYYIKGMAIYDDNIPDGADIVVYSNKSVSKGKEGALKECKDDPANPFGATLTASGQNYYESKNGEYIQTSPGIYKKKEKGLLSIDDKSYDLSPINKIKDEGEWGNGKKRLSSQFLSKQSLQMIQTQLDLTFKAKADEYESIMELTNPMVKKKLLNDFAEGCDKSAKHLDAAALPRQATKVIIPVPELKDTEVYAPTYKNGEKLCLIRYPHGGTFEIPTLVVNNNNSAAKNLLGQAKDAIGINKKVADRLSGADFDGDFVLTIPTNDKVKISTRNPLAKLENFDPKAQYPGYEGMKVMTARQKGIEMGKISNLITDMTLQNPTDDELARAVRHSMVVIDAEKHKLNWKLSEEENSIDALKRKYQKNPEKAKGYGGASSLISRAESEVRTEKLQMVNKDGKKTYTADPETGKKLMAPSGEKYYNKKGELVTRMQSYKAMDLVDDARKLSNGTPQEEAYASYANKLKDLANNSRKEALNIETPKRDPIAAKTYDKEVESLDAKLNIAKSNAPLERQAIAKTSAKITDLRTNHPEMFDDKEQKSKLKKIKATMMNESRLEVGAKKESIEISDREWEAIQAHAISGSKLNEILNNCNMDTVRKLATPHNDRGISDAKQSRIKALASSGHSIAEIADIMDVSSSTVSKYL